MKISSLLPVAFGVTALALPATPPPAKSFNINDVKNAMSAIDQGTDAINSASSKIVKAGEGAYASFAGNAQSSLGTLYANYKKDLASALAYLDKIESGLDKARQAYQKNGDLNQNFWF